MRSKIFPLIGVFILVAALVVSLLSSGHVVAGPLAAPTPQTYTKSKADPALVTWFDARSITADTRVCADLRNYDLSDISWVINQGTVNTTTLTLQFSNDNTNFVSSAQTVVSANAADADGFNRFLVYGRYACILADVTNSNAIVISAYGVAK